MRLSRTNLFLLLGVLVLGGLDYLGSAPGGSQRVVERLFPTFFADQAQRVLLEGPEGSVELERGEKGWVCTNRFGYPARADWTAHLMRAMASLTTLDLLSADPKRHGEYGLDDQAVRVRIWSDEEVPLVDLLQGRDAPGGRACYVRRFGEDEVYRAPNLTRISTNVVSWLDLYWLRFEPLLVKEIRIESADLSEAREFVREEKRYVWRRGEQVVARSQVEELLKTAASLFLADVVAPPEDAEERLGEVALHLELTLLDDRVLVAEFGGPRDGRVLARRRDPDGWLVALPESTVSLLVERALGL